MLFETRPMGQSFAREVVGLRLWEPQHGQTIDELRALWAHHPVLVFRRQALSENELADFSACFGPLERTVRTDWASPVRPEVSLISNLKDAQARPIGGLGDGEIQWHSDQSYMMQAATGAMLYALELPAEGGTTSWVDLCAAYAGLSTRLKRAVEGRRAIFSYTKRLAGYQGADRVISEEAKRKTPPVLHPLVHTHPATGRPALYLDSTTTIGIDGMDDASGAALLDEIYEFSDSARVRLSPSLAGRRRPIVGQRLYNASSRAVRSVGAPPDEADDDVSAPRSSHRPRRQSRRRLSRPIRPGSAKTTISCSRGAAPCRAGGHCRSNLLSVTPERKIFLYPLPAYRAGRHRPSSLQRGLRPL